MLASPATFLRGAAIVMAHDLTQTPVVGLRGWICGDAHLDNFGGFATPERNYIFDLNDFDEAYEGPWEWDVKRLAASLAVTARVNGVSDSAQHAAVEGCVRSYRTRMRELAEMRFLDAWYSRLDTEDAVESFDNERLIERARMGRPLPNQCRIVADTGVAGAGRVPDRGRSAARVAYHATAGKPPASSLDGVSGHAV